MNEFDLKRNRAETIVKVLLGGIICFLMAPFIFIAIKGFVGLVVAGVLSFIALNMVPWFAAKVGNWRLKALKHEASKNPVETLERAFEVKKNGLIQYRQSIVTFEGEVNNFRGVINEHKKLYPDDTRYDEKFDKMCQLLDHRKKKYKIAQGQLAAFDEVIDRARSEWKVYQMAVKLDAAAGAGEDFESKLMKDTALDAIQTGMNTAFAELEISLLDDAPIPPPTPTLPAPTTKPKQLSVGLSYLDLEAYDSTTTTKTV